MNIAFFISDHGFGHIMRNLAVMKEAVKCGHRVLLVTGERHILLARQYLGDEFISIPMHTDGGLIVKPGTLNIDVEATKEMAVRYAGEFPDRIMFAKKVFADHAIDKVVVDIVPWALTAAKEAGLPSYLMASFTWLEQYEWFLDKETLSVFEKAFCDADKVLMYELANRPTRERYADHIDVGFIARPFDIGKAEKIRSMHRQPIVFLSLGGSNSGLDFDIDVSGLPYDFISTEGLRLKGDNVTFLPFNVENTQDYIKAADYCISKAGWASVAELMLSGNKAALLTRPDVPEDSMIIEELLKRDEILAVSVEELKDIGSVIKRMETKLWKQISYKDNYKMAADIICR